MKLWIDNGTGLVDYTTHVVAGTLDIEDAINVPTLITFALVNTRASFQVPLQGAYVKIISEKYFDIHGNGKILATGFVSNIPERQYLGLSQMAGVARNFQHYQYTVKVTSDEWLLNTKDLPYIPAFINQTTGQILANLAEALCPNFYDTTTLVASGDLVPFYEYQPEKNWSDVAKDFGDGFRYRYKVINKQIIWQPFGNQPASVSYDDSPGTDQLSIKKGAGFSPPELQSNVLSVPPVNDCIVMGQTEPQTICEDNFVGDGFTGNFPLRHSMWEGSTSTLINDDWSEGSFNTGLWTVFDQFNAFSLIGQLNVVGGDGTLNSDYIAANSGVELGGGIVVQGGITTFIDACSGILGGLYREQNNYTLANCVAGFRITSSPNTKSSGTSGASGVIIQPIYNGQLVGPQVVSKYSHQYGLQIVINANRADRYDQIYRDVDTLTQFGGVHKDSPATVLFQIVDYDESIIVTTNNLNPQFLNLQNWQIPITITTYQQSASGGDLPGFGVFVPVNCEKMNLTLSNTIVAFPPQGFLQVAGLTGASGGMLPLLPQQLGTVIGGLLYPNYLMYVLGFGLVGQTATISKSNGDFDQVSFYVDTIPSVGARIKFRSWEAATAVARVQDQANIQQAAVISGDDGVRAAILTGLKPPPRTSQECEYAAAAAIKDRENPQFQGTYSFYDAFWDNTQDYPRSGLYFACNSPNRGINNQNFFIHTARAQVTELRDETIQFAVEYGQDLYLEKVQAKFLERTESILLPQQASLPTTAIQLAQVGVAYADDLVQATMISASPTGVIIDLGAPPVTGVEIRGSDFGWGVDQKNLIGVFNTQQILLPRTVYDETYYLRQRNGNLLSRFSTKIRVVQPLTPASPIVIGADGQHIQLDFNGDIRNIYGCEIRLNNVPSVAVSVQIQVSSIQSTASSVIFTVNNTLGISIGDFVSFFESTSTDPYNFFVGLGGLGTYYYVTGVTGNTITCIKPPLVTANVTWTLPSGQTATLTKNATLNALAVTAVSFDSKTGNVTWTTASPHGLTAGSSLWASVGVNPCVDGVWLVSQVLGTTKFVTQVVTLSVCASSNSIPIPAGAVTGSLSQLGDPTNVGGGQQQVLFKRVIATQADLYFDLSPAWIQNMIAQAAQINGTVTASCYFFNLCWDYSLPETVVVFSEVLSHRLEAMRDFGGAGCCDCLNVEDFGAVGDGVTDDTAAIQAALDRAAANVITIAASGNVTGAGTSTMVCIHSNLTCLITPQVNDSCSGVGFGQSRVCLFIDSGVTLNIDGTLIVGSSAHGSSLPVTMIENRNAFTGGSDSDILIRGKGTLNGNAVTGGQVVPLLKHTNFSGGTEADTSADALAGNSSYIVFDGNDTFYVMSSFGDGSALAGQVRKFSGTGNYLGVLGGFPILQSHPEWWPWGAGRPGAGFFIINHPTYGQWVLFCAGAVWGMRMAAMNTSTGVTTNFIVPIYDGLESGGNSAGIDIDDQGNIWIVSTDFTGAYAGIPRVQKIIFSTDLGTGDVAIGTDPSQPAGGWNLTTYLGWISAGAIVFDPVTKNLVLMGANAGGIGIAARVNQNSNFSIIVSSTSLPSYGQPVNVGADGCWLAIGGSLVDFYKIRASDLTVIQHQTIFDYGQSFSLSSSLFWYDSVNNFGYLRTHSHTVLLLNLNNPTPAGVSFCKDPQAAGGVNVSYLGHIGSPDGKYLATQYKGTDLGYNSAFLDFFSPFGPAGTVIGIRFYNTSRTRVRDIRIEATTLAAIEWGQSDNGEIIDTYATGPNFISYGFVLDTLTNFTVARNVINGAAGGVLSTGGLIGIAEYGCSDGLIAENTVEGVSQQLFLHRSAGFENGTAKTSKGLLIEENNFSDGTGAGYNAVEIIGTAGSIIFRGNTIDSNQQMGMYISGLNGTTIGGNIITNNSGGGLSAGGTLLDVSIVDNVIKGNSNFDLAMPQTEGTISPLYDNGTNTVYAFNPAIDSQAYYSTGRTPIVNNVTSGKVGQAFPLSGPASLIYAIKGGANPVVQIGTSVAVQIGAFTLEFPDEEISYAGISSLSGGGGNGLYFVFVDDPWHDGQTNIQYGMTQNADDLATSQCRLFLGQIWLLSSGGGVGTGGGSLPVSTQAQPPYIISTMWNSTIPANTVLIRHTPAKDTPFFFSGFDACSGVADTTATATATFSIQRNGVQVGTMVFGTGATNPSFTGNPTLFTYPDELKLIAPASPDATLADIGVTLKALRLTATTVQLGLGLSDNLNNWQDALTSTNPFLSDNLNNWQDQIQMMMDQNKLYVFENINHFQDSLVLSRFGTPSFGDAMQMADGTATVSVSGSQIQIYIGPPQTSNNMEVLGQAYTASSLNANNTSAADGFGTTFLPAAVNAGDAIPKSVSKIPIANYLYSGFNGYVFAHAVAWFNGGTNSHPDVGYNDATQAQINAMVSDMKSRGVQVVVLDWYGPSAHSTNTMSDQVAGYIKTACESDGQMKFCICLDQGAIKDVANHDSVSYLTAAETCADYLNSTYYPSSAYFKYSSRPMLHEFAVDTLLSSTDLTTFRSYLTSTAGNPLFIAYYQGSTQFSASWSDGAFAWVGPGQVSTTYLNNFYTAAQANPSKLAIGTLRKGFDDDLTANSVTTLDGFGDWVTNGTLRTLSQSHGQTWLDCFNRVNAFYSSANQIFGMMLVTWDDYQEGTEIETGIAPAGSSVYFDPQSPIEPAIAVSAAGATISWSINASALTGLYDHLGFYVSTDGVNFIYRGSISASGKLPSGSLNIQTQFGLASGSYQVIVRLVGIPCVRNEASSAVSTSF